MTPDIYREVGRVESEAAAKATLQSDAIVVECARCSAFLVADPETEDPEQ